MRFTAAALVASVPVVLAGCNRDNCFRNLIDSRYSSAASAFCQTYTTATITAATAIPTILKNCQGSASRVSSACSCVFPATTTTTTTSASATPTQGLNDVAKANGKEYFGTATDESDGSWSDASYTVTLDNNHIFGQLTPANYMKWYATEPERGTFTFTGGDDLVSRAQSHGQIVRCHNLVWHSQLPDYLTDAAAQNYDNATIIDILHDHIFGLVQHWGASCNQWDVVNEALNEDGTYRESLWYNITGPQYIPIAFSFAAQALAEIGASDQVKLFYNDYNIEFPGPKSTGALNIVKQLQSQGVRIDGVGLQSHFIVGETPSRASQVANMETFTALGLQVAQTELDVRFESLPPTAAGLAQQEADYTSSVGACKDVAGCIGITVWDFSDKYSWIPGTFPGQGDADPYDINNQVKPGVYQAILDGLAS